MDLFAANSDSVLIIGVGATGARVAGQGAANASGVDACLRPCWAVAGSNVAELIASGIERKILVSIAEGPFAKKSVEESLHEKLEVLQRLSEHKSLVVLIGSPADSHASLIMPSIAAKMRQFSSALVCAITTPVLGISAAGAGATFEALESAVDLWLPLKLDGIAERFETASIAAVQLELERRLLHATETLSLALVHGIENGQITTSALRQNLGFAGDFHSSYVETSGIDAPARAVDAALAQLELTDCRGTALLLVTKSEMSVSQIQTICSLLSTATRGNSALISTAIRAGADEDASCIVLMKKARSRNVVPLAAAIPHG